MSNECNLIAQQLIYRGLLTEIGKTERFGIYNLCDAIYVVIGDTTDMGKDGQLNAYGINTSIDVVKRMLGGEGDKAFADYYFGMDDENQQKAGVLVGPTNYEVFNRWKARTQAEGPTKLIDTEFEEQLGVREHSKTR